MKKTVIVCDVTGDEGNILPLSLKGFTITSHLDAAGDTDEERTHETRVLDLSHSGALKLLQAFWETLEDQNRWPAFDSMRYLDKCIDRAKGIAVDVPIGTFKKVK